MDNVKQAPAQAEKHIQLCQTIEDLRKIEAGLENLKDRITGKLAAPAELVEATSPVASYMSFYEILCNAPSMIKALEDRCQELIDEIEALLF